MVNTQFATALHILMSLAYMEKYDSEKETQVHSEELAKSAGTNPVVIRRMLSSLKKNGLIKARRGKSGGIQLGKSADNITLADIYTSLKLNDPIKPHNKTPLKECPVSCSIHSIMTGLKEGYDKTTLKYLESQKLSDLVKKIKTK